jgi:hypothetical protein
MHRAWKIARRKLPGKGGGISRPASDALSREDWEDHFSCLFSRDPQQDTALRIPLTGRSDETLDEPFTAEAIAKRGHRALGPDGFSLDHLKVFRYDQITCQAIANFMNICVNSAEIPDIWEHAFLHVLYKGKGPIDDANNYRGITLKSQLLKLLESMLCQRLRAWAEKNQLLPEEQIAYRPGKIGADHIFSLAVLRDLGTTRRTPLHTAFIDLRKAFPSVNRQKLMEKLSSLGVSDKMLKILGRLYSNDSFSLLLGESSTDTRFRVTTGVHEGSPLSPLLFILYVAGLVSHLRETGASEGGIRLPDGSRIFCVLYADDVLLIATSATALQRLIDETTDFFRQAGMEVNPQKSDVVVFSRSDRFLNIPLAIDNIPKELAAEAKYLGVIFEQGSYWKLQKEAMTLRCRSALGRCKVICRSLGLSAADAMVQIFDMFASSIYRYSLGAWGPTAGDLSVLDKVFADFIRSRFRLPASTGLNSILMQFGRRCVQCDGFFLASVQVARGLASPETIWGRVLSSLLQDTRVRWIRSVTDRLVLMGLFEEVTRTPVNFLEHRKEYGLVFAQWCHHNHLTTPTGNSSDFFRVGRPYGVMPAIHDEPSYRTRYFLMLIMSCWRWGLENGENYPEFCPACAVRVDSEHLMFTCELTEYIRSNFYDFTGVRFEPEALEDPAISSAVTDACVSICNFVEGFQTGQSVQRLL